LKQFGPEPTQAIEPLHRLEQWSVTNERGMEIETVGRYSESVVKARFRPRDLGRLVLVVICHNNKGKSAWRFSQIIPGSHCCLMRPRA